ncbi:somatostatin receptor type 5-like [Patiria miniata]|uniref:G-protein coupled receptors family 1 profile domain-containing protein n=1 Tax=Patiria miniata TaxID=46514 RepID=A0A913Z4V0_PATMI|nr:somatostatin receptor type 5-like [Patiria miniata]
MEQTLWLRIFNTIIGIVGILGNGLVCVVIGRVSSMQTRTNAFIFHQAVVDLLGSFMTLLQSEVPLPDPVSNDALGWVVCRVLYSRFALFLLYVISTYNLLSLTMERYFAIVHPFKYQAAFAKRPRLKVGVVIAACWIIGTVLNSYVLTIFNVQEGKCVSSVANRSKVIGSLSIILQYIVPVAVMLFAYIRISVELKRGAARVGPAPANVGPAAGASTADGDAHQADMMESLLRARRNTFKMLLIVFITFLVCWTPNQIIYFLFNLGWNLGFDEWYYVLSVVMVAANSCVNPAIYAFKYRQFRKGLRQVFCRRLMRLEEASNSRSFRN